MKSRHFTIPVFVPELACPNRCVFCNQYSISGKIHQPTSDEVAAEVEKYLSTIPDGSQAEIGFFGGNFTGISRNQQAAYLEEASRYVKNGKVKSIRLSTRPDYIHGEILEFLKQYPVETIELGVQSLDEEVLLLSGRGHTAVKVREASGLIKNSGFKLGLQMMIGLPGDTPEKALHTATEIVKLGADCTRIYPTLVIRNTYLAQLWEKGIYNPLSTEQAVSLSAKIVRYFRRCQVKILRIGLHPSEGLLRGTDLLAGPFHPSFGELVNSQIWREVFSEDPLLNGNMDQPASAEKQLLIAVPPGQLNAAIGHKSSNRKWLSEKFSKVKFQTDQQLQDGEYRVSVG